MTNTNTALSITTSPESLPVRAAILEFALMLANEVQTNTERAETHAHCLAIKTCVLAFESRGTITLPIGDEKIKVKYNLAGRTFVHSVVMGLIGNDAGLTAQETIDLYTAIIAVAKFSGDSARTEFQEKNNEKNQTERKITSTGKPYVVSIPRRVTVPAVVAPVVEVPPTVKK